MFLRIFKANLEKLNKVAPHLKKNMDCVLMRQNIGDMENLVRFAADYGFSSVRFHSLGINPIIGNEKDAPDLYPHYLMEQAKKSGKCSRRAGHQDTAAPDQAAPGRIRGIGSGKYTK